MEKNESMTGEAGIFPHSLKEAYEPLSCLSWGDGGAAWLCQRKEGADRVMIKTADTSEAEYRLKNEYEILRAIARSDRPAARLFPSPLELRELADPPHRLALIRSWVPGRSLESLVESPSAHPGLPREKAMQYILEVLDQLDFLHHLKPPVIHRDIKPQNVIVDPEEQCHLIDLDIARMRREPSDADTLIIGTRLTSPPEQYGFRSTDARSDLYSTGVLLRYCLTGEYDAAADDTLPSDLKAVVRKATRFDPEDRYQQVAEFRADLLALLPSSRRSRRGGKIRRAALYALLLLCVFALGRLSAAVFPPSSPSAVPESALYTGTVLDAEGGSPENPEAAPLRVTEAMFDGDAALYADFQQGFCEDCAAVIRPDGMHIVRYGEYLKHLETMELTRRVPLSENELKMYLDALRKSPCWRSAIMILIVERDIESLEPFRIKYVSEQYCLEFRGCTVPEDPSPLKTAVPYLTDLGCYNGTAVPWSSLDFLRTANHLSIVSLVFDGSTEVDLSALSALESPWMLTLENVSVDAETLEVISGMGTLESLRLYNCDLTDVTPLAKLENLKQLDLGRNLIRDLSPLDRLPRLEELYTEGNPIGQKES